AGAQNPLTVLMNSSKTITASFAVVPPLFSFGSAAYGVNEAGGAVSLTVSNNGVAGTVDFSTSDGTPSGGDGNLVRHTASQGPLIFTNGETSKTFAIGIRDNFLIGPDKSFQVQLNNASGGSASLTNPSFATVTIHYNDSPTNPLVRAIPGPVPDRSGR